MNAIAENLLKMSDSQIDASMKPLIERWSDPPTPLQVLEVLDYCINGSLAAGFVVRTLQVVYDIRCKDCCVTHDDVVKQATWRAALAEKGEGEG